MTDDDRLRAHLAALADDLGEDASAITPARVRAAHRRRRQVRLTVAGVAAAVVVLVGGLPLAAGLVSAPDPPGRDGAGTPTTGAPATTPGTTPAPTVPPSVTPTGDPVPAARYEDRLAVWECLVDRGLEPDPPPGGDEFAASGGRWTPYDGLTGRDAVDGPAACPLPPG